VSAACADKEANDSDDLIAAITGHQHESAADLNDVDRQQLAREADAKRVAARVNNGGGLICKSAKSVNKGGTKPSQTALKTKVNLCVRRTVTLRSKKSLLAHSDRALLTNGILSNSLETCTPET
jgi:hypothetical protein